MSRAGRPLATSSATGPSRVAAAVVALTVLLVGGLGYLVLRFGGTAEPGGSGRLSLRPAPPAAARPALRPSRSQTRARVLVDPGWVARTATATGIPAPALRAYADAQLQVTAARPGCHLGWNTLAGIGLIESRHGTTGGRTLDADGRSRPRIIGPALDGSRGYAAIRATPGSTAWHGDRVWDHAVRTHAVPLLDLGPLGRRR